MEKCIIETIGSIMLVDPITNQFIPEDRPTLVLWTQFCQSRTGAGQIKVLQAGLPLEATDEEFQEFLKESEDKDLAIASFTSKFLEEPEEVQKSDERLALEKQAGELKVTFRANIGDVALQEKINKALEA